MKIAVAQINTIVGDLSGNTEKAILAISKAKKDCADLILFPELCLTGYPPDDFLLLNHFLDEAERQLDRVVVASKGINVVIGTVRRNTNKTEKPLYNSAAVITDGQLQGFQDKALLPTYDVFSERRYFEPATKAKLWNINTQKVAITICEDLWQHGEELTQVSYRYDPVNELKQLNPDLLINLSASPFSIGKAERRIEVCKKSALTLNCPVILCNLVGGNDSLIFDGHSIFIGDDGELRQIGKGFEEDFFVIDTTKNYSVIFFNENEMEEIFYALVLGVRDYFAKLGFKKACLGISGGIDSALVACIAKEALGKENVLGLIMPSKYSSEGSKNDAKKLADNLGINHKTISIESLFKEYQNVLHPFFKDMKEDITEENLQARIRGMLLMAFSNKFGYIVLSTGNKSEIAMGYSTLYGDMCGGLSVINDLTKDQVYKLANWINLSKEIIPTDTITKAPSAELKPNQKDSDSLPDYVIVDNVLRGYVEEYHSPKQISQKYGYPLSLVEDLVKKIHRSEYKRRQSPPGLRITEKSFSVGYRFPIVQRWS